MGPNHIARKHQGQPLPKLKLSNTICNIWTKLDVQIIKNGFEKAGIYPFNDRVIDKSKFDPESLKRWVNRNSNQDSTNSQEIENNHTFNLDFVKIEPQETGNIIFDHDNVRLELQGN